MAEVFGKRGVPQKQTVSQNPEGHAAPEGEASVFEWPSDDDGVKNDPIGLISGTLTSIGQVGAYVFAGLVVLTIVLGGLGDIGGNPYQLSGRQAQHWMEAGDKHCRSMPEIPGFEYSDCMRQWRAYTR